MERRRIVIADDHAVFRVGVCAVIEADPRFEVVGTAADGRELVRLVDLLRPDVVVSDVAMPELSGIDAWQIVKTKNLETTAVAEHLDPSSS